MVHTLFSNCCSTCCISSKVHDPRPSPNSLLHYLILIKLEEKVGDFHENIEKPKLLKQGRLIMYRFATSRSSIFFAKQAVSSFKCCHFEENYSKKHLQLLSNITKTYQRFIHTRGISSKRHRGTCVPSKKNFKIFSQF